MEHITYAMLKFSFLSYCGLLCLVYRHEELIEKIKKQVALEEKAHHIVEELTDITPDEESLKDAVSY